MSLNVLDALTPTTPVQRTEAPQPRGPGAPGLGNDFGKALDDLLHSQRGEAERTGTAPLRFSRHADARLTSRGIALDPSQLERLGQAVDQLDRRGAKESLVVMDDHAFIVGVPKRTVVTAMSRTEAVGNIFTQIDSTLFVP